MQDIVSYFLELSSSLGYLGVFLLMVIESSFIPFPSEIVVPPAAYLAARGEMNVYIVVLAGVAGSLVGALVNYFLAMYLGRPLVYNLVSKKWARVFLLSRSKVERAEKYFLEYGSLSTFLGRLVPAVRQLISLPAGFVRMDFGKFVFFTSLGAGLWVAILAALGYFLGANEEIFSKYYAYVVWGVLAVVSCTVICVLVFKRRLRSRA